VNLGKTWGVLPVLIDKAARTPGTSISVISESLPHLRRGAIRDFLNIMKATNRFIKSNWNITNSVYTFANGSYIEFFSADDDAKLRGARRNILYINECNNISFEAYTQLAMRTDGEIYLDYNPVNLFWVHTEVIGSENAEVLTLTYKDNEALSPSVIEFLEEKIRLSLTSDYWKNWCEVYVFGRVGRLEGTIFNNWEEIDKIPEEARLIGYGLDFGYSNDPSALVGVYKYNEKIIIDEVIYSKGLLNSDLNNLFKQHQVGREPIYADSAEPKSIDELRKYGHNVIGAIKGKDSVIFGIDILQGYQMLVTKRSTNLKEELTKYSWTKDKETLKNVPLDAWNHCLDALRYLAMSKLNKPAKIGIRGAGR
jgi:phage terminase large subunit